MTLKLVVTKGLSIEAPTSYTKKVIYIIAGKEKNLWNYI